MRVSARLRNSVYRGISRNDNHRSDPGAGCRVTSPLLLSKEPVRALRSGNRAAAVQDTKNRLPRDAPQVVRPTIWEI